MPLRRPLRPVTRTAAARPPPDGLGPSIWRWAEAIDLVDRDVWSRVTLGEGGTPLQPVDPARPSVLAKLEFLMPTLSFKDRGAVVLVALAVSLSARTLIADSSGNAGTAFAAYAARAGLAARIFVPAATPAAKLASMRAYGATVELVEGDRQAAADAATAAVVAAGPDAFYASHAWHPAFLEGTKTLAFELWLQLGRRAPDELVVPVGNGSLLLGAANGFAELQRAGLIATPPRLIAVQAAACSPLAAAWRAGAPAPLAVTPRATRAEGIAIARPARGSQILATIAATGGRVLRVEEQDIAGAARPSPPGGSTSSRRRQPPTPAPWLTSPSSPATASWSSLFAAPG